MMLSCLSCVCCVPAQAVCWSILSPVCCPRLWYRVAEAVGSPCIGVRFARDLTGYCSSLLVLLFVCCTLTGTPTAKAERMGFNKCSLAAQATSREVVSFVRHCRGRVVRDDVSSSRERCEGHGGEGLYVARLLGGGPRLVHRVVVPDAAGVRTRRRPLRRQRPQREAVAQRSCHPVRGVPRTEWRSG